MPELQIDVTIANRFISSLSKSLQALCHGCMDFDNGIEIVGYINVNIDSGNKVDYVLNEKVLKSTTNSMTFVSNSFLAKKEQQKQTRDGCCSPIPQTQGITPYPSPRMRGSLPSSQYHRPASQYSPHSQVPGGSQKRPRADDWRLSPKRHRMQNLPAETQSFTEQNSLSSHSPLLPYSDTSFKQPQVPLSTNTVDSTLLLQMNIKKEVLESDNHSATDTEHMTSEDQSDDQTYDSSYETSKVQIKSDPDDAKSDNGETSHTDTSDVASKNTDFKDTFLEPSSPNNTQPTDEDNNESDNQAAAFEQSSKSVSKDNTLTDETNVASTSADNHGDSGSGVSADIEPTSDAPLDYDQAAEDSSYSHSAYDDAGEGSSDAGQFEVIEIDDEDEDVQAMFGDSRRKDLVCPGPLLNTNSEAELTFIENSQTRSTLSHHYPYVPPQSSSVSGTSLTIGRSLHMPNKSLNDPYEAMFMDMSSRSMPLSASFEMGANMAMECHLCGMVLGSRILFQKHMNSSHRLAKALPFTCTKCHMGFFSMSGLQKHVDAHGGRRFTCEICSARFTHKHHWKRHCIKVHKIDYGV